MFKLEPISSPTDLCIVTFNGYNCLAAIRQGRNLVLRLPSKYKIKPDIVSRSQFPILRRPNTAV